MEGFIVTGAKQVEIGMLINIFLSMWSVNGSYKYLAVYWNCIIGNKLAEDSKKYGVENTCTSGNTLSKAAMSYGRARGQIEKERENLQKALGTQVCYLHSFAVVNELLLLFLS